MQSKHITEGDTEMPAKIMTAEDAAALLANLMHARTHSATRRHYTVTGVKTLCGGGVMLSERWAVEGVEHSVSLEDLFMESHGTPREYCQNCTKVRARLERQAAPALEAAAAELVEVEAEPVAPRVLAARLAAGHTVVVDGVTIAPFWLAHAAAGPSTVGDFAEWSAAAAEVLATAVGYASAGTPTVLAVQPYTVPTLAASVGPGRSVVVDGYEITDERVELMRPVLAAEGNTPEAVRVWAVSMTVFGEISLAAGLALCTAAATCPNCEAIHAPGMTLTVELTTCPGEGVARGVDHEHGEDCGAYGAACFTDWDAAHEWARLATVEAPGDAAVYSLGEDGVPTHELAVFVGGEAV